MTDEAITGGCQCGAIRYRIEGPLGKAGICHCRMCQKAFGSWGAALVSVPDGNLTWSRGEPGEFRSSAVVARGFCTDCGTPLYMKEDGYGLWEIAIGSLDKPSLPAKAACPASSALVGCPWSTPWPWPTSPRATATVPLAWAAHPP